MKIQGTKAANMSPINMETQTKKCTKCRVEKETTEFYPRKGGKFGVRADCKECAIARAVAWGKAHPAERNAQNKKWRDAHPDEFRDMVYAWNELHPERAAENRKAWAAENPDKIRGAVDKYQLENPAKTKAISAKRRADKVKASVEWANNFFIEEAYELAKLREKITGIKWHVDHIIPLKGKGVRGLHWEGNLQVIPAKVNMSKGNRYCPDNPHIKQSPWPQCFQQENSGQSE